MQNQFSASQLRDGHFEKDDVETNIAGFNEFDFDYFG